MVQLSNYIELSPAHGKEFGMVHLKECIMLSWCGEVWKVYGSGLQFGCHLFKGQKHVIILHVQLVYILGSFIQIVFNYNCSWKYNLNVLSVLLMSLLIFTKNLFFLCLKFALLRRWKTSSSCGIQTHDSEHEKYAAEGRAW